jgi:hypothetical protein
MTAVFCCLLFPPLLAAAQPNSTAIPRNRAATIDAISASLLQLNATGSAREAIQRQIAETMISSAETDLQPSRSTVGRFLDELTAALSGRKLQRPQTVALAQCLVDVVRPSGVSTMLVAVRTRDLLTVAGVSGPKIPLVIGKLIAIGEEVRGPDDSPAKD